MVNSPEMGVLQGTVEHIIYKNDENGYCVIEMSVSEQELVTVVGIMPFINEGEGIKVLGEWGLHPSFGRQFKACECERTLPASEGAIYKYLSSGAIKGIGMVSAQRIVDRFGERALEIIEHEPERLSAVKGISPKKAQEISKAFRAQFGIRAVMLFLQQFEISPAGAVRIYRRWGMAAVELIKKNPYILCDEIHGIGFEKADTMAAQLGIKPESDERAQAGLKFVLRHNLQNGHTFLPKDKLLSVSRKLLETSTQSIEESLERLVADGELISAEVFGYEALYLPQYYKAEKWSAAKLAFMSNSVPDTEKLSEKALDEMEEKYSITYAPQQRRAIKSALESAVMVLTGGPGTGKTTTIQAMIALFEGSGKKVALCAPTGRAAKRMTELCQRSASTMHRLLEMEYTGDNQLRFGRNESRMLDFDVLIVDELSMVDIQLFEALLRALRTGTRLVMVGDANQLPSVGAGSVLLDIVTSECVTVVELNEIFRQAGTSLIIENAHAINRGEYPDLEIKDGDFFFLERTQGKIAAETVVELCKKRLPERMGLCPFGDIQVICPSRKGESGTATLNASLQKSLNPPAPGKREKTFKEGVFREGDKVMQTRNNYSIPWTKTDTREEGQGVYNGDVGLIEKIDGPMETLHIRFDDRLAEYDFSLLDELELAFAVTVHKSQGSEFPVVILPVVNVPRPLVSRNLLYTAVTRARKMVIIVGDRGCLFAMVDNNRKTARFCGLEAFLREEMEAFGDG